MGLELSLDRLGLVDEDRSVDLLANGLACVADPVLRDRLAAFAWTDSTVVEPHPPPCSASSNLYRRAAQTFWHTLFGARRVEVSDRDARDLYLVLDDVLKEVARVPAGELRELMAASVWARLREFLRPVAASVR